ncbi:MULTISPECIES: formylglycine-generating enzyme family protein [unclassified Lysobacter]|uniref:formylglycine-generating enzyme family protein n=1 Tax=unclassified Lysobacter TaxID=2635362 RepID=UPI001BE9907F|nr:MULTISPECIES: formylglycine-generating enzyme family protein [unclassified Lysobacter]MBT2745696.1 formylglycine-generating enzyme family protein [Lysobacter sp. ISL-42]MBT2749745.1 formylglycine-generating enzyme family protein [Lysobacter sp. ISL-50]MBT2777536.1 formylglycine-generating enzyme family protein [Lysobacter sp. ISL-54]MBT2782024.1 formylglycine-generating enzyme family protein [Lysobacter sp. ISL-52]
MPHYDPAADAAPEDERPRVRHEYKFSHVTTQRYLPLPGKAPGWPFAEIGHWKMEVDATLDDWIAELKDWRREHLIRIGYDDAHYRRPELQWAQRNFVHSQMMAEDRYFYDPVEGRYTVDRYLDDLQRRYGGIDSVLIWHVYPNIGVDDRNQFDLAADLPGGLDGLRGAIADFHRRGVRVFLPTMPWDQGTRDSGRPDWQCVAELVAAVGADGVNGDTYNGVPRAFFDACDQLGHPVVLQPESTISAEEALIWNVQSWGKKAPNEVIPPVAKFKWLESRHMINYENRWGRDRNHDLQYIFFNGVGYNAWENIWGLWNQLTDRDAESLRRIAMIEREFAPNMVSPDWRPYARTLQAGVFASRFPHRGATVWTVVNRHEYEIAGEQIAVDHLDGARYYDLWNGEALTPRIDGARAVLEFAVEGRGFGALLALAAGAEHPDLDAFLARMRERAATPLHRYSAQWRSLQQRLLPIEPVAAVASAPPGMIDIPAGEFDFKVGGVQIEGQTWDGVDVQYPWEDNARRNHRKRMRLPRYFIDRTPVTNAEYLRFVQASGYRPRDAHNYLRDWTDGAPRPGWERRPVTWVSIEDARAYAQWAGKRLPREWEWQYAAQGGDGRLYPWGNDWRDDAVPAPNRGRRLRAPDEVDAHPAGASGFGVLDLIGNVWQWTDEYHDEHTRAAILRGGSSYQPQTSHWYFPQAYRLDQHGKLLLMAPGKDRSGCIGFRCAADAS